MYKLGRAQKLHLKTSIGWSHNAEDQKHILKAPVWQIQTNEDAFTPLNSIKHSDLPLWSISNSYKKP